MRRTSVQSSAFWPLGRKIFAAHQHFALDFEAAGAQSLP
jgi:hypothetical protein